MPDLLIVNQSSLPAEVLEGWLAARVAPEVRWMLGAAGPLSGLEAEAPGEGPLLLIYDSLEQVILTALMQGAGLEAAIHAWEQSAEALLRFWRGRRQSVILAEASFLQGDPAPLSAALGRWVALAAPAPGPADGMPPAAPPAIWRLLASQPRFLSRRLRRLCDELAAGGPARPAAAEEMGPLLEAVTAARAQAEEIRDLCGRTGMLEQENAALRQQADGLRHEAETLRKSLRSAEEAAILRLEAVEAQFVAERGALDSRFRAAEAEAAAAARRAAEELAAARTAAGKAVEAQTRLAQELAVLRERAAGLEEMAERDFRAAAELEEARRQIAELGMTRHQLAALEQQLEVLHSTHTADSRQIAALAEESRLMREQAQAQERRVAEFYASTSWRITAPLRATRRLFKE